nr:PGF-pre-PGF domain-containing protein [Methanofollis sp. W23]
MYTDNIRDQVFTATGYDQFGDEITPLTFTWSSTNENVGTVDSSGTFTGVSVGTTEVQAQSGTVTGTAQIVIKPHPDWDVDLIGAVNRTLDRSTIIDLSRDGPLPYTDPSGKTWEGARLSAVIGLVDDQDPATFNTPLAGRDYTVTIVGKYAGNDKTVHISSRELIEGDKTFITAYKLNGFEIPEEPVDGRTFWPLKLTGSGIANHGRNLEQITEISLEFPPDVQKINVTPVTVKTWDNWDPIQFHAKVFDGNGIELQYVPLTWTSSNLSVGIVNKTGYFTPTGPGKTIVQANFNDVNGSATVEVYPSSLPVRTWIVDRTGDGDYTSVKDAVSIARDGDTVLVRNGTYTEPFEIKTSVMLKSEHGLGSVTIGDEQSSNGQVSVAADNVSISGFIFGETDTKLEDADNCTIVNNKFSECGIQGSTNGAIIQDNHFERGSVSLSGSNIFIGENKLNSGSITVKSCSQVIIKDNLLPGGEISSQDVNYGLIEHNTADGIYMKSQQYTQVINNTFTGTSGSGSRMIAYIMSDCVISNNFLDQGQSKNYALQFKYSLSNVTVSNNVFMGGKRSTLYFDKVRSIQSLNFYMNDIYVSDSSRYGFCYFKRSKCVSLNSTVPVTYIYNGTIYTNFVGNWYQTYTGNDTDGDGLGDTPFTAGGTDHYHPLISPIDNYLVLTPTTITITAPATTLEVTESVNFTAEVFDQRGEAMPRAVPVWSSSNTTRGVVNATTGCFDALSPGEVTVTAGCDGCTGSAVVTVVPATKKTETISFEVPDCTFTEDSSGTHIVSVNASAADIEGDCLALQGDGFTLTVMTTSMEEPVDGRINATYDALVLETDPLVADLPVPGTVSGGIRANLTCLPAGAGITTTLNQTVPEEVVSAFHLAASDAGLEVDEVGFTMNIKKTNLTNGEEITGAVVRMGIDEAWVDAHGGPNAVRIIRWAEDDVQEVLKTKYVGLDASGEMVFEGYSPNGFSLFGFAATLSLSVPGSHESVGGPSSGGDHSDVASFAGSIPEGEKQTFTIDRTAIDQITVEAWDELSGFLVTVEKASLPVEIEMPASTVYEIQKATLYHTDPAAIAGLVLEFSVPKTWLDAHDLSAKQITLMQYANDRWRTFPTTLLSEDGEMVYYSAEADRFSYFAIVSGEVAAAEASVPAEKTPVPATTEVAQVTETSTPPASTTAPKQTPMMEGLALVAIGVAVMMRRR